MKTARAKQPCDVRVYAHGDFSGMTIDLEITPDQKWKAHSVSGYILLSRKGGVTLRLTPAAFRRLFEFREE